VNDDDDVVYGPFGGYAIETEMLPDGRRIRYYSWPDERDTEPMADDDQA